MAEAPFSVVEEVAEAPFSAVEEAAAVAESLSQFLHYRYLQLNHSMATAAKKTTVSAAAWGHEARGI